MVQELEKRTRIDVADVLRGLAVMGIIVSHNKVAMAVSEAHMPE